MQTNVEIRSSIIPLIFLLHFYISNKWFTINPCIPLLGNPIQNAVENGMKTAFNKRNIMKSSMIILKYISLTPPCNENNENYPVILVNKERWGVTNEHLMNLHKEFINQNNREKKKSSNSLQAKLRWSTYPEWNTCHSCAHAAIHTNTNSLALATTPCYCY